MPGCLVQAVCWGLDPMSQQVGSAANTLVAESAAVIAAAQWVLKVADQLLRSARIPSPVSKEAVRCRGQQAILRQWLQSSHQATEINAAMWRIAWSLIRLVVFSMQRSEF